MSYRTAVAACLATLCVAASAATESPTKPSAPGSPGPASNPPAAAPAPSSPATSSAAAKPAPAHGATTPASAGSKYAKKEPAKPVKKVDLNNASLAELQSLPTVREEDAKKIIANRPYSSKSEVMTKAGLPMGVYQAIRYKVELQKPRQAAPKK